MRIRPTEVRAIVDLLVNGDHMDDDTLARTIIETIDRMRAERAWYVLAVKDGSIARQVCYGLFPTAAAAMRAWATGEYAIHKDALAMPLRMFSPERQEVA